MRVNGSLHDILRSNQNRVNDSAMPDDSQEHFSEDDFKDLAEAAVPAPRFSDEPPILTGTEMNGGWDYDYVSEWPCDDRLALITAYYGGMDNLRRGAHLRAIAEWDRQSVKPDEAVLMEMVLPGETPAFSKSDFPSWINYVRIYGKERNRSIFQKEAMWNLAAKMTKS